MQSGNLDTVMIYLSRGLYDGPMRGVRNQLGRL